MLQKGLYDFFPNVFLRTVISETLQSHVTGQKSEKLAIAFKYERAIFEVALKSA